MTLFCVAGRFLAKEQICIAETFLKVGKYYKHDPSLINNFGIHNWPSRVTLTKLIRKYNTSGSVLDFKKPKRPLRGRLVANIADEVRRIIDRMPQELNSNVMANFIERVKVSRAKHCGHLTDMVYLFTCQPLKNLFQLIMCVQLNKQTRVLCQIESVTLN